MKTLVILKSLAKNEKLRWVRNEELENFFLDIDVIRRMFACPELISPDREILGRGFGDIVYRRFMEVLITRLAKGSLVIIDPENEACGIFETLALIFGYTVFYVVGNIPQDFIGKPRKYQLSCYPTKRREELERDVQNFLNLQLHDKKQIKIFQEVEDYWEKDTSEKGTIRLKESDKVLHVSDLHSNYESFLKLPNFNSYGAVIFHGDYIDGPEEGGSRKLMDLAISEKFGSNIIWLEGNHELRLRKYLGWKILAGGGRKEVQDILLKSLPEDFMSTTAKEYEDLGPKEAKDYLMAMNKNLRMFEIIKTPSATYYCTHAGLRFVEQLDIRYIGSVVYGSRDIIRYDRDFSERIKRKAIWSVHAHCKYPDRWEPLRYSGVVNLDPHDETEIVYGEQINNKWKICQIENSN